MTALVLTSICLTQLRDQQIEACARDRLAELDELDVPQFKQDPAAAILPSARVLPQLDGEFVRVEVLSAVRMLKDVERAAPVIMSFEATVINDNDEPLQSLFNGLPVMSVNWSSLDQQPDPGVAPGPGESSTNPSTSRLPIVC